MEFKVFVSWFHPISKSGKITVIIQGCCVCYQQVCILLISVLERILHAVDSGFCEVIGNLTMLVLYTSFRITKHDTETVTKIVLFFTSVIKMKHCTWDCSYDFIIWMFRKHSTMQLVIFQAHWMFGIPCCYHCILSFMFILLLLVAVL